MSEQAFFKFAAERHAIYVRRARVKADPDEGAHHFDGNNFLWSDDPIFQRYHFCNVYRELDRGTTWLRDEWYVPNYRHRNLWFAACLARRINWPATLEEIGFPRLWRPDRALGILKARMARGEKTFHNAYRVMVGAATGPMEDYVIGDAVQVLWENRAGWRKLESLYDDTDLTVQVVTEWLQGFHGWGPFLSFQVALDLTMTRYLRNAPDRTTYAVIGPGSARGLNRVRRRPVDQRLAEADAADEMSDLRVRSRSAWPKEYPALRACDVEHALCEYDKYERIRTGENTAMRRYRGGEVG